MTNFTESQLEKAFIDLLGQQDIPHIKGEEIKRTDDEVIIDKDLRDFLSRKYKKHNLTEKEIHRIILCLKTYPASDLYESNKAMRSEKMGLTNVPLFRVKEKHRTRQKLSSSRIFCKN